MEVEALRRTVSLDPTLAGICGVDPIGESRQVRRTRG